MSVLRFLHLRDKGNYIFKKKQIFFCFQMQKQILSFCTGLCKLIIRHWFGSRLFG